MVKDDEAVIERCLESVKKVVDCICIYDMGSTDRTIKIVEDFVKRTGIPGKVVYQSDNNDNAGTDRTLAIKAAKMTLEEFKLPLNESYILVLDPDMTLKAESNFTKTKLDADAYQLLVKCLPLSHYRYSMHCLRASLSWESAGIIEETFTTKTPYCALKLQTLTIEDRTEGERKAARLKRNLTLLTEGLKKEPNNASYQFYLAQTKRALKLYDDAILKYLARIELGGEKEEVWFSKYMLGECFEEMGEWDHALYWYLEAYQYNENRAEPLRKIATYYRLHGQNDLAFLFAKHGSRIPMPQDQTLFSMSPLQNYEFDEELSIAAYYTRFKNEGLIAANELILTRNVPWHIKSQTYQNLLYYVQNLKNTHFEPITPELPLIEKGFNERYHPMNPSILKTENGYALICRAVNYTQKGAKIFNTIDLNGTFRTKNFLIQYDRNFNMLSKNEIVENLERKRFPAWSIEGLEDCRIFQFNKQFWFTCTSCDTNPTGQRQISLCKLPNKTNDNMLNVQQLTPLKGPDLNRCEKNWLPFIKDGFLQIVYSYDPFVIYKPDLETGACEAIHHYEPIHDFSNFRGSAGPIPFDQGFLILVHEVVILPDHQRVYLHRFLYLDSNFIVKKASIPFTFKHQGVEYCCSMTIDHSGERVVMPIGIEDHEAYLCFINFETILSLLNPLSLGN
jgi:glycosyltransferase involved in cell wall biosynthesis